MKRKYIVKLAIIIISIMLISIGISKNNLAIVSNKVDIIALQETVNVNEYNAKIIPIKGEGATIEYSQNDEKNIVSISNGYSWAGWEYEFENIVNDQIYIVEANITTSDLEFDNNDFGANIAIKKSNGYFSGTVYSLDRVNTNTTKTIKAVFIPTQNQKTLKIQILLGKNDSLVKGKMILNSLSIKEADESLTISTSTNKKVRTVFWAKDVQNKGITSEQLQNHVNKLANIYDECLELVGQSSKTTTLLTPISVKDTLYFSFTNDLNGKAIATNPIEYSIDELDAVKQNDLGWGPIWYLGYLIKGTPLTDGKITTTKGAYEFDNRIWATTIPTYALAKLNYQLAGLNDTKSGYENLLDIFEKSYNNFKENGTYENDAVTYLLLKTKKNNQVDWEAFKKTFTWFNDLSEEEASEINTKSLKFLWFIKKLDEYSKADVQSIFKDDELERILNQYGSTSKPLSNIKINNNTLKNGEKISITTTPNDYQDTIIYKIDNDSVSIDDFGNITVLDSKVKSVKITVFSLMNNSVKAEKVFIINETEENNSKIPTIENKDNKNNDITPPITDNKDIKNNDLPTTDNKNNETNTITPQNDNKDIKNNNPISKEVNNENNESNENEDIVLQDDKNEIVDLMPQDDKSLIPKAMEIKNNLTNDEIIQPVNQEKPNFIAFMLWFILFIIAISSLIVFYRNKAMKKYYQT